MAATNRRDGVRIGLMLLLLTVSYIRAQDEPRDEEDDRYAEFLDLRNSCKFPMFSLGFLAEPSGKFYYEVCETTPQDGDLSRLCQNMFYLTSDMCNQTQVSEQKKKKIDMQMSSELMKFAKDETPFCTRLERDRNSSINLGTFLPKDMNCETACKENVAEKLCEFNFFAIIVYENITAAAAGQSGREPNRGSSSTGPIGVAGDIVSAKTTGTNVRSTTPPLANKSKNKIVTVENKEGDTNIGQEVNNTGSPLNGPHASVPVDGSAVEPKGTDVDTDRPVAVDNTNKTIVKVEGLSGKDQHVPPATEGGDVLSGKDPDQTPATVDRDGLSGKDPQKTPATEGGDGLSGKDPQKTPATEGGDGLSGKDPQKTPATEGRDGLSGKDPQKTPATEGRDGLSGKDPQKIPATVDRDGLSGKDPQKIPATEGRDGQREKENHTTLGVEGGDGQSGKDTHDTDSDFSEPGDGRRQPVVHSDTAKSPVQIKKLEKEYEAPSSGNFMAYFLTAVVLCIAGYVVFHNKQKIIAFVIEGRSGQGRRRTNGSGEYKKLQSNVEESV